MNMQKLTKWKRWLGDANTPGTIVRELVDLALVRKVYAGVNEMVRSNKMLQQPSAFHAVFSSNYAYSVLMFIRRQVRPHGNSIGLFMLAEDLRDNCQLITQDYFASLYTRQAADKNEQEARMRWGRSVFLKKFAGKEKIHLDPAIIEVDLSDLKEVFNKSSSYTDRRIAHLDKREPAHIPTYKELESWCDVLNSKLKKYQMLLNAADFQITPSLNHDWQAIFRKAWLPESDSS